MKFTKVFSMAAAASMAVGAFADANNMLISFSTDGDTYADGSTVLTNEWYALCWAPEGKAFGGLNYDCTVVDAGDKLVKVGSLARVLSENPYKVGCPFVVFQINSEEASTYNGGNFYVYLLDTRNAEKTGVASAVVKDGRNVPAEINGASASTTAFTAVSSGALDINGTEGSAVAAKDRNWAESNVSGDVTEARISSITPNGDSVTFTVEGLMAGVKYNIKAGETPSTVKNYALDVPRTVSDEATFEIAPGDARFFKIVREPLVK